MQADSGSNLLQCWIARAAARAADKAWIVSADDGRTVSYGRLREIVGRFAAFAHSRGLGPKDRVALLANNSIEHLLCYLGVMAAGATICTVHVEMNRNQLDNIFTRLRPKLILYEEALRLDDLLAGATTPRLRLGRFDQPAAETLFAELAHCAPGGTQVAAGPEDDAVILFTSGTSARPKGVVLNFREHLANIDPAADGFGITANDKIYDFRSFNWSSAQLLGGLVPVSRGATLIMAAKFSARRFFEHVRDHKVTVAAGNPTTINILLNTDTEAHRDNMPALRFVTSSSAPLTLEQWRRFERRFGIPVAQAYGSSETGWIAAVSGEQRRHGTVGRPLAYHQLAIVDGNGCRLPSGEIGHVEVGGFAGHPYRYLAEGGAIEVGSRGRICTGDLGSLDADGFLTLTGREKELIIRGGAKISPVEIDCCLVQRSEVGEAATIGVPDAVYGEEVVSYVVARPGATIDPAELLRYCRTTLPAFKAPKQILVTTALPKTERGKLDRRALAARWRKSNGG
ncbi:MAG TPA: class I adenylate-forming enzyme family protein [Xanthobacteraceae bacterium]|jgi:acyl-coenzyme A synthetase/AMP-(fatty) acid ligase